jgi:hypothetical protein
MESKTISKNTLDQRIHIDHRTAQRLANDLLGGRHRVVRWRSQNHHTFTGDRRACAHTRLYQIVKTFLIRKQLTHTRMQL